MCHGGGPGHLWDVWLLRPSGVCFNFNWLDYFELCLMELEANTMEANGISSRVYQLKSI